MTMVDSRITFHQATAVAAAMASVCLAAPMAAASSTQSFAYSEFRALRQSAAWDALRAKLQRWKRLPLDWDGDDGIAPSAETIDAGMSTILQLEFAAVPVPVATVASDGEVSFEWAQGDGFASISLIEGRQLLAFLREPGSTEPLRVDAPFSLDAIKPFLERIGAFG